MTTLLGAVALIKSVLVYGAAGAIAGGLAYFAGRLIAGGTGLIVSIIVGALVVVAAVNLVGENNKEAALAARVALAQEQAWVAALEHEKNALQAVLAEQDAIEKRHLEELEAEKQRVEELEALIAKRPDDSTTCATEDEMRAIQGIR